MPPMDTCWLTRRCSRRPSAAAARQVVGQAKRTCPLLMLAVESPELSCRSGTQLGTPREPNVVSQIGWRYNVPASAPTRSVEPR